MYQLLMNFLLNENNCSKQTSNILESDYCYNFIFHESLFKPLFWINNTKDLIFKLNLLFDESTK